MEKDIKYYRLEEVDPMEKARELLEWMDQAGFYVFHESQSALDAIGVYKDEDGEAISDIEQCNIATGTKIGILLSDFEYDRMKGLDGKYKEEE